MRKLGRKAGIKLPYGRKTFNGRIYYPQRRFKQKTKAKELVAKFRKQNLAARIVKTSKGYDVYRSACYKVGTKQWGSYRPGRQRLYQLQQVTGKHGGVSELSPWMTAAEAKMFVRGYNKALGKRKGRIRFK